MYAHYRPVAKTSPTVSRKGSEHDLMLSEDDPGKEAEAVSVLERLSITCRLVKDFQQEIQLIARSANRNRLHSLSGSGRVPYVYT